MESLEESGLFATRKVGDMLAHVLTMRRIGAPWTVAIPDISAALLAETTAAGLPFQGFVK